MENHDYSCVHCAEGVYHRNPKKKNNQKLICFMQPLKPDKSKLSNLNVFKIFLNTLISTLPPVDNIKYNLLYSVYFGYNYEDTIFCDCSKNGNI
eukprot:UN02917